MNFEQEKQKVLNGEYSHNDIFKLLDEIERREKHIIEAANIAVENIKLRAVVKAAKEAQMYGKGKQDFEKAIEMLEEG